VSRNCICLRPVTYTCHSLGGAEALTSYAALLRREKTFGGKWSDERSALHLHLTTQRRFTQIRSSRGRTNAPPFPHELLSPLSNRCCSTVACIQQSPLGISRRSLSSGSRAKKTSKDDQYLLMQRSAYSENFTCRHHSCMMLKTRPSARPVATSHICSGGNSYSLGCRHTAQRLRKEEKAT